MLGVVAAATVVAGGWSLKRGAAAAARPLAPIAWLAGGQWRPASNETGIARRFEWSEGGLFLRERRADPGGDPAGEVLYYRHHGEDEIALHGVLREGHVEGLLRAMPGGALELQTRQWSLDGEILLWRERVVPQGPHRLAWTRWRLTESGEVLDREEILVRSRR